MKKASFSEERWDRGRASEPPGPATLAERDPGAFSWAEGKSLDSTVSKTKQLMFSTVCAVTLHGRQTRAVDNFTVQVPGEQKSFFFFLFNKKFRLYTALGGPLATRLCLAEDIVSLLFSKRMCLISQRYHRAEKQRVLLTRGLSVCPLLGARVTQELAGASDAGGIALGPWQGLLQGH